jgi:hypothetical protein
MRHKLNEYRSNERELAETATNRLNTEPYTLMRNESKRPKYELEYDHSANLFVIWATYYPMDNAQFCRKQIRNKRKPLMLHTI